MTLLLRAGRLLLGAVVAAAATPACYNAGGGMAPPPASFYFPTGLAVSAGGNVLYAVNSDFDLQWNGGTLQSYDLFLIRQHAAQLVQAIASSTSPPPSIPLLEPWQGGLCPGHPPPPTNDQSGIGVPLGEACAPPVDSTFYERDSAVLGAFATDLQLAPPPGTGQPATRLFAPIRGNGTITWADVAPDTGTPPVEGQPFPPFSLQCGTRVDGRCDGEHQTGDDPNAIGDTRHTTLSGDPFGMAQSEDGTALVVTSLTAQQTSVLTTGLGATPVVDPAMQFVLGGMPSGGNGIAAVPHDPGAGYTRCEDDADAPPCVRPAFLQTNTGAGEIDLIRYYDDDGSTLHRPFIQKEAVYPLTLQSGGTDFRGIAIDPTPRIACEASAATPAQKTACAQKAARVFIASRTPPALVLGEIGQPVHGGGYDPDALAITGLVPMPNGPSRVYLAPIVDQAGRYELRVFVVCFDSNLVWVFDPEAGAFENAIPTGTGPYAMAFDPFDLTQVATHATVPIDPRQPADLALKRYRFAYVASFTHSYVQVLDLDDSMPSQQTFESVVYTLGKPTPPKGS
jgi:hypothetical protein